jgi:hypothetical protein
MKKVIVVFGLGLFVAIYVIRLLQPLNFMTYLLNDLPQPDFNFKGHFYGKEFIEHTEWAISVSKV